MCPVSDLDDPLRSCFTSSSECIFPVRPTENSDFTSLRAEKYLTIFPRCTDIYLIHILDIDEGFHEGHIYSDCWSILHLESHKIALTLSNESCEIFLSEMTKFWSIESRRVRSLDIIGDSFGIVRIASREDYIGLTATPFEGEDASGTETLRCRCSSFSYFQRIDSDDLR